MKIRKYSGAHHLLNHTFILTSVIIRQTQYEYWIRVSNTIDIIVSKGDGLAAIGAKGANCFKAERSWVQIRASYSGWPGHYNNVGCSARFEISFELNLLPRVNKVTLLLLWLLGQKELWLSGQKKPTVYPVKEGELAIRAKRIIWLSEKQV